VSEPFGFSGRLQDIMMENGLGVDLLAELSGVPADVIWRAVRGQVSDPLTVSLLADALEVDTITLAIGGTSTDSPYPTHLAHLETYRSADALLATMRDYCITYEEARDLFEVRQKGVCDENGWIRIYKLFNGRLPSKRTTPLWQHEIDGILRGVREPPTGAKGPDGYSDPGAAACCRCGHQGTWLGTRCSQCGWCEGCD